MFISLPADIWARRPQDMATAVRSLSDDEDIESILADIPFFAVGLLAFGTFTFLLIMGRVNRPLISLHLAIFLGFIAAILDLSQLLSRGRAAVDLALDMSSVTALVVAREVAFALSNGFKFRFFWYFVAQPPRGDVSADDGRMHCGSWRRWGLAGLILKWTLSVGSLAVPVLQLLWRIVTRYHRFGPVYEVENTMEVIISAVFILKLLLNTYLVALSPTFMGPRWRTLLVYLPVMAALSVNIVIATGNIVSFLFSETVLGRFLQGVEFYVLIVFVLTTTFYHLRDVPSQNRGRKRTSSFQGLPEMMGTESVFRVSPPTVSTPRIFSVLGQRRPSQRSHKTEIQDRRPSVTYTRQSSTSRLSSWMIPRNLAGRVAATSSGPDGDRLWNQDEAERGVSPGGNSVIVNRESKMSRNSFDQSPTEPKESAKWQDPMFTAVMSEPLTLGDVLANVASRAPSVLSPITIPPRVLARPFASDSPRSGTPISAGASESPVFGLNGKIRSRPPPSPDRESPMDFEPPRKFPRDSVRSSGISHLLRQQEELDKSIAALKLFSRDSVVASPRNSGLTALSDGGKAGPTSASQSEFSLSNFPAPPWNRESIDTVEIAKPAPQPTVPVEQAEKKTEAKGGVEEDDGERSRSPFDLPRPMMPAAAAEHSRNPSVPVSETGYLSEVGRSQRVDSGGTQYEITSFIGDLTAPGQKTGSASLISAIGFQDKGKASASPPRAYDDTSRIPQTIAEDDDATPQASMDITRAAPSQSSPVYPILQISSPPTGSTPTPPKIAPGAGRGAFPGPANTPFMHRTVGLPARPRLMVSNPLSPLVERLSPSDEYERPRPAPYPSKYGAGGS